MFTLFHSRPDLLGLDLKACQDRGLFIGLWSNQTEGVIARRLDDPTTGPPTLLRDLYGALNEARAAILAHDQEAALLVHSTMRANAWALDLVGDFETVQAFAQRHKVQALTYLPELGSASIIGQLSTLETLAVEAHSWGLHPVMRPTWALMVYQDRTEQVD